MRRRASGTPRTTVDPGAQQQVEALLRLVPADREHARRLRLLPAPRRCSAEALAMTRVFALSAANRGASASVRLTTAATRG